MSKNILIIGGNKFVGKLLADMLLQIKKYNIILLNRTGYLKGHNVLKCDRNNLKQLEKTLQNLEFDCIIDMCLYNTTQARLSIPIFEKITKKYIFVSSIASKLPFFGKYGRNKKSVEEYISKSSLSYVCLQPTYIIGERDTTNRLEYYINQIISNKPIEIEGKGDELINFIDCEDLAKLIILLITQNKFENKTFEIGNGEYTSLLDLVYRLSKFNNTIHPAQLKLNSFYSPYKNQQCIASNLEIKRYLNYKFTDLDETLKRLWKFYTFNKNIIIS